MGGGAPAGALRHFPDRGFADGAVCGQRFGANAQELLFGLVAVGDEAARKDGRSTRDIRYAMREEAAGAGFGQCQRLFSIRERANDDGFERFIVGAVNQFGQTLAHNPFALGDDRGGVFTPGGEPDIDVTHPGAVAEFQAGFHERLERGGNAFLDEGFAQPGGLERATNKSVGDREALSQEREHLAEKHGP